MSLSFDVCCKSSLLLITFSPGDCCALIVVPCVQTEPDKKHQTRTKWIRKAERVSMKWRDPASFVPYNWNHCKMILFGVLIYIDHFQNSLVLVSLRWDKCWFATIILKFIGSNSQSYVYILSFFVAILFEVQCYPGSPRSSFISMNKHISYELVPKIRNSGTFPLQLKLYTLDIIVYIITVTSHLNFHPWKCLARIAFNDIFVAKN